jgi:hypothetical protein
MRIGKDQPIWNFFQSFLEVLNRLFNLPSPKTDSSELVMFDSEFDILFHLWRVKEYLNSSAEKRSFS